MQQANGSVDSVFSKGYTASMNGSALPSKGRNASSGTTAVANGRQNVDADAAGTSNDLWSSILNDVKSSRATPIKNLIVLGQPNVGRSTLLSNLAAQSPSGFVSDPSSTSTTDKPGLPRSVSTATVNGRGGQIGSTESHPFHANVAADLGLGYGYFDVGDEDGEDVLARIGVYQVSSTHKSSLALLPIALSETASRRKGPAKTPAATSKDKNERIDTLRTSQPCLEALEDSMFLIVLDWERPWTFLSQLAEWLDIIREVIEQAQRQTQQQHGDSVSFADLQERLEADIRAYKEPNAFDVSFVQDTSIDADVGETSAANAMVAVSNPTALNDADKSPLPEGSLTMNFGVPIAVICTKADTTAQLERQRSFKEEQFDYIQQVLRTICLKYGAALFFTAQNQPQSFTVLRDYIMHRLVASTMQHSATGAFHFQHRAITVERDILVVPTGWDSFGKIRALREGFDCASTANAWSWDMQVEQRRRRLNLAKGAREAEEAAEKEVDRRNLPDLIPTDGTAIASAIKLYEDIVEDFNATRPSAATTHGEVKPPDDQAFLLQHFNALQREQSDTTKNARPSLSHSANANASASRTGVVGPMQSSSLRLPFVERVLQERSTLDDRGGNASPMPKPKRDMMDGSNPSSGRGTPISSSGFGRGAASSGRQSPSIAVVDRPSSSHSRPTSPLGAGAGISPSSGVGTPKQSEVLHSFFQSLLKEKPAGQSGAGSGALSASGQSGRAAQSSRSQGGAADR